MNEKKIPTLTWILIGLSGLIYSGGISIARLRQSDYSVQTAQIKVDAISKSSKILFASKQLEEIANKLQQKEEAYNLLVIEYQNLFKHNQPLKMLEPAMKRIEIINAKNNLQTIESEVEKIANSVSQNIEAISRY